MRSTGSGKPPCRLFRARLESAAEMAACLPCRAPFASLRGRRMSPWRFLLLRSAADEAEIITIGTLPQSRRQGIGAAPHRCRARSVAQPRHRPALIEVADSNDAALALYRKFGFALGRQAARIITSMPTGGARMRRSCARTYRREQSARRDLARGLRLPHFAAHAGAEASRRHRLAPCPHLPALVSSPRRRILGLKLNCIGERPKQPA